MEITTTAETGSSHGTLSRLGTFIGRRAWALIAIWACLLIAMAAIGSGAMARLATESGMDESSESFEAYNALKDTFPGKVPDLTVIYSSPTLTVDSPDFQSAVRQAIAKIPSEHASNIVNGLDQLGALAAQPPTPAVAGSPTAPAPGAPASTAAPAPSGVTTKLISDDRRAVKVFVSLPLTDDTTVLMKHYDAVRPHVSADHPDIRTDVAGIAAMGRDFLDMSARDTLRAEMIALPIVFILSVFIFKGLVAALLPTLIGSIAVVGSLATLRGVTELTAVSSTSLMVVTLLGMGLAIDYCLFVISRFREELGEGRGRQAAIAAVARTIPTAGRTVAFSAVVVAVSLAGLIVFPINTVRSVAYAAIPAVIVGALAAVTLLPAMLAVLGHRINAAQVKLPGTRRSDGAAWGRIAGAVMRRPLAYLLTAGAVLALLGAPFLHVKWGGADEMLLPQNAASRMAIAADQEHFGGQRAWAYTLVQGADVPIQQRYVADLGAVHGVRSVKPFMAGTSPRGEQVTMFMIDWVGTTQSDDSQRIVRDLRAVHIAQGTTLIGGPTAITLDTATALGRSIPTMLAVIAVAMLVVLGLAFRSVLLPIKAIVVSALSMGASFGVLTWVFQDGHGAKLLGFQAPGYVEMSTPVIMMAILFGLSMDYEVFMLSRIREEWERTGDTTHAVAHGLTKTGGVITSAAVLLAVVIGGFATSGIVFVKMLGVGMLVAVLLDATVVRGVLVPAAMRLMGRWNWWPSRAQVAR